MRAMLFIKVF